MHRVQSSDFPVQNSVSSDGLQVGRMDRKDSWFEGSQGVLQNDGRIPVTRAGNIQTDDVRIEYLQGLLGDDMGNHIVEVQVVGSSCDMSQNSAHVHNAVDGIDSVPS